MGSLEELAAGLRRRLRAPLKPLYLEADFGLGFDKPAGSGAAADSYVSDPAKPVPYLPRPVRFADSDRWKQWLVTDQRVGRRPDRCPDV